MAKTVSSQVASNEKRWHLHLKYKLKKKIEIANDATEKNKNK